MLNLFGKRKIAFVFSGGGSLGAIQVGMLRALMERDIYPDLVVGTSIGSINASYIAEEPTLDRVRYMEEVWCSVKRKHVFPLKVYQILKILFGKTNYLIPHDGIIKIMKKIDLRKLEEAKIPCIIVATDILTGEKIVLEEGSVIKAVLGSTAIPGIFAPVKVGDRYLVDGGVFSQTPISSAVSHGAKDIFVLTTGFPPPLKKPPKSVFEVMQRSLTLLLSAQLKKSLILYGKEARLHIIPPSYPINLPVYNFTKTNDLIKHAYEDTLKWIDNGGIKEQPTDEAILVHDYFEGEEDQVVMKSS